MIWIGASALLATAVFVVVLLYFWSTIRELEAVREQLEQANQRLTRLASIDGLTEIANRRHFDEKLASEVRRCQREHLPLSLILCDIDSFKPYNDFYGHTRGDDTLKRVAQAVAKTFRRAGDLAARYGGEEFAIVLPGVDAKQAWLFADRLRRNIWRLSIPNAASVVADRVTLSGGVATSMPGQIYSAEELIQAADSALYRAKGSGRNRVEGYQAHQLQAEAEATQTTLEAAANPTAKAG